MPINKLYTKVNIYCKLIFAGDTINIIMILTNSAGCETLELQHWK